MNKEGLREEEFVYFQQGEPQLRRTIADDIRNTRESLLQEPSDADDSRRTYNLDHDTQVYQTLFKYRFGNSVAYQREKDSLNQYTKLQLETHLGERFGVALSQYSLEIKNGEMWSEIGNEPFTAMLRRGQQYREKNGSTEVVREKAEVTGALKTEKILTDPKAAIGTSMVSLSPPGKEGSIYKHNFYDIFTLCQDENGKRYIEVGRYSSGVKLHEYLPKIPELNSQYEIPTDIDDAYCLSHPIEVNKPQFATPETIHQFLHVEHTYLSQEVFNECIRMNAGLITSYINTLCDNPYSLMTRDKKFDAILNGADEAVEKTKKNPRSGNATIIYERPFTDYDIARLSALKVRVLSTACGISGGAQRNQIFEPSTYNGQVWSPFSVSAFSEEYSFDIKGDCRNCKRKNLYVGPCFICEGCDKEIKLKALVKEAA